MKWFVSTQKFLFSSIAKQRQSCIFRCYHYATVHYATVQKENDKCMSTIGISVVGLGVRHRSMAW